LLGGELPAEQAVDVLVAHAFAPRHYAVGGGLGGGVDTRVIGVGLVQAAIHTKHQIIRDRPAEVEVGTFAHAFGVVFRRQVVGGQRAAELARRALGDDIDHPAHCPGTVACRCRAAQDLDALDLFGRYPVGFTTGIAVAAPAIALGIARRRRLAVNQDQGVFRAHAAQVDLAVVAAGTAGAVAGEVDPRFAADDIGQVIGRRALLDIFGGDDRHPRRLLQFLCSGAQYAGFFKLQRLAGTIHRQIGGLYRYFVTLALKCVSEQCGRSQSGHESQ